MTQIDPKALDAARRAYHTTYTTPDGPLRGAITAYLAALPPVDVAGLVEFLRRRGYGNDKRFYQAATALERIARERDDAQARITVLEGALRKLLACPAIADGNHAEPAYFCAETVAAESEGRAALAQTGGETRHADDLAVDRFAAAMKEKLAKKRADGRGGWENKAECSNELLSRLLREHVEKGDPLDVGNLAMMLHQRGERIVLAQKGGDGWLPIESAPDGNSKIMIIGGAWPEPTIVIADGGWWRFRKTHNDNGGVPTHWRPLPAPPAREGE